MRAAICDDRAEDAQLVAQYVREWGESREESVALEMFPSALVTLLVRLSEVWKRVVMFPSASSIRVDRLSDI